MLHLHHRVELAQAWIDRFRARSPLFACILGFTETGLVSGISAAGATPEDRKYTAIADAEFLYNGAQPHPNYPLPPLTVGASPALISRAVIVGQSIPLYLINAGLPIPPPVPFVELGGQPAACVSSGKALPLEIVRHLLHQGLQWGEQLSRECDYLILGECVVGGTTTALAVLLGLGWHVAGMVNSSHPQCNHAQKWTIAQTGLVRSPLPFTSPLEVVAAVGDPMQIVVAGMAIAASRQS
ncbi:MAG: TIGR00303 family protein, partial [Leptolyngbyaceae cyanobacterium SL_7_1]|nr:TIGR00303 family protein [Leptolyngbyaceae cyanobacterium SL_7_1]